MSRRGPPDSVVRRGRQYHASRLLVLSEAYAFRRCQARGRQRWFGSTWRAVWVGSRSLRFFFCPWQLNVTLGKNQAQYQNQRWGGFFIGDRWRSSITMKRCGRLTFGTTTYRGRQRRHVKRRFVLGFWYRNVAQGRQTCMSTKTPMRCGRVC